jgi:ABC-type sugar transport system substrate-binding protein
MTASNDERPGGQLCGLLAGRPFDRRTLLRAAVGAGLGVSASGVLAACGQYLVIPPAPPEYAIDLTSEPINGFATLIADRARRRGVEIQFDTTFSVDTFTMDTASKPEIDPVNDRYPLAYDVVVVEPSDPASLDPLARAYLGRGGKLVTYLTPLARQTAQITVSSSELGARLAVDAATWARAKLGAGARGLYVLPEPAFLSNPFLAGIADAERAARVAFTRLLPTVTLRTVTGPSRAVDALRSDPETRVVLCAIDADALLIAQMLRQSEQRVSRRSLYLGGLGAPTPYGAELLAELRRDDPLRAIVAARPRDLADALVDLPAALLRHHPPYNLEVKPQLLTPQSAALRAFERDYEVPPNTESFLNPITSKPVRTTG